MTTKEWYTGSDTSGRVAAGIESIIGHMDDQTAGAVEIETIDNLLTIEKETNWRAFLLGLMGTIYNDLKNLEKAKTILRQSIGGYRVFLDSFDEVISVYCQSCYTLATILFDDELFNEAQFYFTRCIPYMKEVFEKTYTANIYSYLNICMNLTGNNADALIFAEAAAFARHCDCEALENLMTAYAETGDLEKASEVFDHMSHRCQDYEHFDRVLEFARQMLGESGPVN